VHASLTQKGGGKKKMNAFNLFAGLERTMFVPLLGCFVYFFVLFYQKRFTKQRGKRTWS